MKKQFMMTAILVLSTLETNAAAQPLTEENFCQEQLKQCIISHLSPSSPHQEDPCLETFCQIPAEDSFLRGSRRKTPVKNMREVVSHFASRLSDSGKHLFLQQITDSKGYQEPFLKMAAQIDDVPMARLLLKYGAGSGSSALVPSLLDHALFEGDYSMSRLLLSKSDWFSGMASILRVIVVS